jgi:ADP-heptose:LPS heptosyltransferase
MGYGDEIIGSGLARGARARGFRVAFGDGVKIHWSSWCPEIFYNNPNVASPGSENSKDLIWVHHYKGKRKYNKLENGKWVWNYDFRPARGEFFFDEAEINIIKSFKPGFVVIEPNVPWQKEVAQNKDWGEGKYEEVARRLMLQGVKVIQFKHKNSRRMIKSASIVELPKFRHVIAALSQASLYIGPEGGMHHAAAAVAVPAVVIFGGFIPPEVTGYDFHVNLTGGVKACGNIMPCAHCRLAMNKISVDEVRLEAERILGL